MKCWGMRGRGYPYMDLLQNTYGMFQNNKGGMLWLEQSEIKGRDDK